MENANWGAHTILGRTLPDPAMSHSSYLKSRWIAEKQTLNPVGVGLPQPIPIYRALCHIIYTFLIREHTPHHTIPSRSRS